jgi:hypothetical protein
VTGKYAYLEASGCSGKMAALVSPCISLAGATNPSMQFAYHMWGSGMGSLHIDLFVDGAWINDVVPELAGDKGDNWLTTAVPLAAWSGKTINVRFRGVTGTDEKSDMAIDAIRIEQGLGVAPGGKQAAMQVFPNPSSRLFNVVLTGVSGEGRLTVTDLSGKTLQQKAFSPVGGNASLQVDMSGHAAGVYFLSIRTGEGTVREKIIRL